jgi:PAS domain S-box-containing protein
LRRSQFSLDNVADYPIWSNSEGRIVEVSQSTCRQLQYSRDELLGLTLFDLDPALTPERWRAHWKAIQESGSRVIETHHRNKNGDLLSVEISANHFVFNGDEYDCAFCRNIAKRRQMEESLALTQLSVDRAPDLISWVDKDGRFLYTNQAFCDLFGYAAEELSGMHTWDLDEDESRDEFRANWRRASALGLIRHEAALRGKDGRVHLVDISSRNVQLNECSVGVSFLRDITERKRAEDSLRESEERYRHLFELVSCSQARYLYATATGRSSVFSAYTRTSPTAPRRSER